MTEYIIIVALVAVGAILIVTLFGTQIKETFHRITGTVGGQSTTDRTAKQNEGKSQAEANKEREMDTFDKGQNAQR
jgi:Flp pilus assembly pilin Flp